MPRRRLRRFALVAVIAILGLALILPVVNWIWREHVIPAEFSGSGMSGTFRSDQYFSVSGRLFLEPMKSDLSSGETCEVDAILYYNLWSQYRPGQTVRTRLTCTVFDNQIEGSNFSAPASYEGSAEFVARKRGQDEPMIRFTGLPGSITVGSYNTATPDDAGHFVLTSP